MLGKSPGLRVLGECALSVGLVVAALVVGFGAVATIGARAMMFAGLN